MANEKATLLDVLHFERNSLIRRCANEIRGLIRDLEIVAKQLEAGRVPSSNPLQDAPRIAHDLGELRGFETAIERGEKDPRSGRGG